MFKRLFGRGTVDTVKSQDVYRRVSGGEPIVILDVRQPDEYRDAHVAGSKLIPLPELSRRLDELPRDKPIVAICRSGNRSGQAVQTLARAGFTNVSNLEGGIIDWQRQGLPVERKR